MNSLLKKITFLLLISFLFSSCSVISGIFKAGIGVGVFIVIAIVAILIFIIKKFSSKD